MSATATVRTPTSGRARERSCWTPPGCLWSKSWRLLGEARLRELFASAQLNIEKVQCVGLATVREGPLQKHFQRQCPKRKHPWQGRFEITIARLCSSACARAPYFHRGQPVRRGIGIGQADPDAEPDDKGVSGRSPGAFAVTLVIVPAARKLNLPAPSVPRERDPARRTVHSNCGLPELPATTLPYPGKMAYWGGHVEPAPKDYLVYWGWGAPGPSPSATVAAERSRGGQNSAGWPAIRWCRHAYGRLRKPARGDAWAGVSTQYYQRDAAGTDADISNPREQLAGIWVDDANSITGLPKTTRRARPAPSNTYGTSRPRRHRAVAHFRIRDFADADLIIAQPPAYSDPNALNSGYCAFHDYTLPARGRHLQRLTPSISYTNMPYALAINSGAPTSAARTRSTRPPGQARWLLDRPRSRDRGDGHRSGRRGYLGQRHHRRPTTGVGMTRSTPTRTATSARGWVSHSTPRCAG